MKITGIGESGHFGSAKQTSLESLIFDGASLALADAGLERSDLDGVVISASDQVDGRAISSMLTSGPAGAYVNEEINLASSPGHGLMMAILQILSGTHQRILFSSWGKASENEAGTTQGVEHFSTEPFYERDGGMTAISAAAMQALAHRRTAGESDVDRAAAAITARNGGKGSPDAVIKSPFVAFPLRELEWPEEVDGSYTIVLERPGREVDSVSIDGFGWSTEPGRIADRDLTGIPALRAAASDAYERAGISGASDIQSWELHDYTPDAEILAYSALGICASGEAVPAAFEGLSGVNAAGGSLAGEAPFGGPLRKILSAVRQVRGTAGEFQVPDARRAGVQMASGFAGQFQSVFVIGDSE